MISDAKLAGLGRTELVSVIRSLEEELKQVDDLLFDVDYDVEHQIECHANTLPEYTRSLVELLRKIDNVGEPRRQREMDELEKR